MSSHAAALHGICPVALYVQLSAAGIVSDVCPMACLCTGIGAVACFWLSRLFIPYSDNAPARCGSFTPRGGGVDYR